MFFRYFYWKNSIEFFDQSKALDSPDGDITLDAEFTFDLKTNKITLLEIPEKEQKIIIIRKVGKLWTDLNETLASSQTDIGYFLRAGTSELPK